MKTLDGGESEVSGRRCYYPTDYGDRQWERLLAFALSRADSFECAVPYPYVMQDLRSAPLWPPELNRLGEHMIDRHVSLIRWEVLRAYPIQYVRYRMESEVVDYVHGIGGLEDWSWDGKAPRDPTFYLGNAPLLATDSLQGRIAVYVDARDLATLTGAGIRLVEPLGVKPEPWPTP
jgi:hypothetical protein